MHRYADLGRADRPPEAAAAAHRVGRSGAGTLCAGTTWCCGHAGTRVCMVTTMCCEAERLCTLNAWENSGPVPGHLCSCLRLRVVPPATGCRRSVFPPFSHVHTCDRRRVLPRSSEYSGSSRSRLSRTRGAITATGGTCVKSSVLTMAPWCAVIGDSTCFLYCIRRGNQTFSRGY